MVSVCVRSSRRRGRARQSASSRSRRSTTASCCGTARGSPTWPASSRRACASHRQRRPSYVLPVLILSHRPLSSRLSNMAGILSQGLRIAPPEAPVVRPPSPPLPVPQSPSATPRPPLPVPHSPSPTPHPPLPVPHSPSPTPLPPLPVPHSPSPTPRPPLPVPPLPVPPTPRPPTPRPPLPVPHSPGQTEERVASLCQHDIIWTLILVVVFWCKRIQTSNYILVVSMLLIELYFNTWPRCISDGLHVWQGPLFCRHGVEERKLLLHIEVQLCRPSVAVWSGSREHVSHPTPSPHPTPSSSDPLTSPCPLTTTLPHPSSHPLAPLHRQSPVRSVRGLENLSVLEFYFQNSRPWKCFNFLN